MRFVDTNVLLYALSRDPAERDKARIANEILTDRDLALSVQVLQELYVQCTHPRRTNRLQHDVASRLVESFTRFAIQELTLPVVRAAMETANRYQLSYWDAAILEAARACGCETVLSEDLGHGQDYGGVRVESPFR